jgi:muconolactone delta-isomerase
MITAARRTYRELCSEYITVIYSLAYPSNCLFGVAEHGNLEGQLTLQIAMFGYAEQAIGEVSAHPYL